MARACGLRIGPRRYELVVLEGSPRKHKIVSYASGDLSVGDDDPSESARKVLHEAIKAHNVPTDNIGIAIDTGMAAFRTLRLPFDDRTKIEQIIKFEVESQLPQWNIDDVIVDFHVMESTKDSSELLVMGVPKEGLSAVLDTCARSGFEPLEAELETTAMVNAACGAEICAVDDAQILVHIGEESTSVVVMDGGKVREMRAIHIGAATHEAPKPKPAKEKITEDEDEGGTDSSFLDDETLDEVDPIEAQRRVEQTIKRIRRELGRTVSAARTVNKIDAIYVCGRELPGLIGSSILDVPVYILDVFEEDSGQPADGFGELVVPYGVAVRQLGGGILKPSLRREELRYAGAFEKVELPLAIVCLLLLTYLGVQAIFSFRELGDLNRKMGWVLASNNSHLVGDLKIGQSGNLRNPSDQVKAYLKRTSLRLGLDEGYPGDPDRTRFEQLNQIKNMLNREVIAIEKDLGRDSEIVQPQSALHAMTLILVELDKLSEQQGARPSLRKISSSFQQGRSGKPDGVLVKLDVTFFAESAFVATQQFEQFKEIVGNMPWAETPESRSTDPLETGEGIYVGGLSIKVDLSKLPKEEN